MRRPHASAQTVAGVTGERETSHVCELRQWYPRGIVIFHKTPRISATAPGEPSVGVERANRKKRRSTPVRRRAVVGLTLVATGFAFGQFHALAATGESAGRPYIVRPASAAASAPAGNPLWAIPIRSMSATRERPLFSPSRRPPPAPIAAAPPAPPPPSPPAPPAPPPLTLVGTVLGDGGGIGVFVDQATKNVVRLRIGEGHDGWTLHEIRSRTAILEEDKRKATLALSPPDGESQDGISDAKSNGTEPSPALAQRATPPPVAPPGKWVDGDGRVIDPPASRARAQTGTRAQNASHGSWVDGDGRVISPPVAQAGLKARPSGSWVDGDGRLIGPPPTLVGQSAQP